MTELRLVSNPNATRTARRGMVYVATVAGEHVDTPTLHEAPDSQPHGRMDRALAMMLASTGRAPETFFDDGFWGDRHSV